VEEPVEGLGISGVESYGSADTDLVNVKNDLRGKCDEERMIELDHDMVL
jgi:hypothetical protein